MPAAAGGIHPSLASVPVWSYWTGQQPAAIGLCLESLRRNSPSALVLSDDYWTSGDYAGEIPVRSILRLAPNLRSDILRAWLLFCHGGVWIDADAIVWRDLRGLGQHWQHCGAADFIAYRGRKMGLCSALIAAPQGSEIARSYWEAVVQRVAAGRLRELSLGPRALRRVVSRRATTTKVHLLAPRLVHPITPRQSDRLLRDGPWRPRPGAWCCMLTHRPLSRWAHLDRDAILHSATLLGRLFRRALDFAPTEKR